MGSKTEVEKYLATITGIRPAIKSLPEASRKLPLFIRHLYKLREVELFEKRVVLAIATTGEHHTPAEFAKHCDQLQRALSAPVALVLPQVTSYNRNRLVQMRVPFIVPGRQLFLPTLLVDLRENNLSLKTSRSKLSAGAQTVVLYRLLCGPVHELSLSELAEKLGYSAMTLTNAANELAERELAEVKNYGRKRHIDFPLTGRDLWKQAEPHLRSPVRNSYWVQRNSKEDLPLFEAGISALEKMTSITGEALPVMAQASKRIKAWLRDDAITKLPNEDEADLCLQEWRYDPAPFAEDNRVDRLSLFLSLRETDDERVRLALREMMEGVAWQP